MRLNLYWCGYDLIDVEVHIARKRPEEPSEARMVYNVDIDTHVDPDTPEPDTYVRFGF